MGVLDVGKENYILAPLYDVISIGVYNGEAHDLGLALSKTRRKFGKYNLDDYLAITNSLKIGKIKAKQVIKDSIEIFLDNFPLYIQKTIDFENKHQLEIENTRISKKKFSASLISMYQHRIIQLKKQGVLQELGLVEKYGGVLMREKRSSL